MEEHIGGGSTCMALILSPGVLIVIMLFARQTQIPTMYGIREGDLRFYLLFGIFISPFQVMMDILMNHATEVAHGVKIYDYMLYAKWRWRNRLTRWLFDDPRFDQSISETVQSVNHLCFSPQFYFIETYYTWGVVLLLLAFTTFLRWEVNPFADPAFLYFIAQQLIANRMLDKIIRWLTFALLWKPKDNAAARAFSNSVARGLKQKAAEISTHEFRTWFYERHKGWILNNLQQVFTPRSVKRYRGRLSEIYADILRLQPPHRYTAPKAREDEPAHPVLAVEAVNDNDSEEEANILALPEAKPDPRLQELDAFEAMSPGKESGASPTAAIHAATETWPLLPLDPDREPPPGITNLAALSGLSWFRTAKRRTEMLRLAENWKRECVLAEACETCGVKATDPEAQRPNGAWTEAGPRLRVVESHDVHRLMAEFEEFHGVPPLPFEEQNWRAWLERHHFLATLCWRCVVVLGVRPGTPSPSERGEAQPRSRVEPSMRAAGTLEALAAGPKSSLSQLEQMRAEMSSDDGSEGSGPPDGNPAMEVFPEWLEVNVSHPSRSMILLWARKARQRVRMLRQMQESSSSTQEEEQEGNHPFSRHIPMA